MDAFKMLEDFPGQFEPVKVQEMDLQDYQGIVFSGMGGSGIVGDFMKLFIGVDKPILSIKGYELPPFVKDGWLLVCTSYSGNTEETINVLEQALKRGLKPVCVSSGGKIGEIAKDNKLLHIPLPQGYPPRYALGFMLSALLSLFGMEEEIHRVKEHLTSHKESIKSNAKSIAQGLFGHLPVVYGTPLTEPVAFRWKTQINENSKTLCYNAILPEMHHNEVVGLDNASIRDLCAFTLLWDPQDHPRVIKRVSITDEIFKEMGIFLRLLQGKGTTLIERLMYLTYLGDWVSLYLAELYKQDPIPVKVIDFIKKSLV
ncbi:MAG: bifunctional phosphoglucose/phosphomannose isomerase [Aquificaceae bacterium]